MKQDQTGKKLKQRTAKADGKIEKFQAKVKAGVSKRVGIEAGYL